MSSDPSRMERTEDVVWWSTWLGWGMALVGLVDGVLMTAQRKERPCPDGTYFPEGTTDFQCYVHPQLGIGVAVVALSVGLAVLVFMANVAARASLNSQGRAAVVDDADVH